MRYKEWHRIQSTGRCPQRSLSPAPEWVAHTGIKPTTVTSLTQYNQLNWVTIFGFKCKGNSLLKANFTSLILKLGNMPDSQLTKCKIMLSAGLLWGYLLWTLRRIEKWMQKRILTQLEQTSEVMFCHVYLVMVLLTLFKTFIFFVFLSLKTTSLFLNSITFLIIIFNLKSNFFPGFFPLFSASLFYYHRQKQGGN